MLETIDNCPLCNHTHFTTRLEVKDHTTSGESFQIARCDSCGFVLTNPRPTADAIHQYYQSDKYISHTGGNNSLFDRVYILARHFTLRWKLATITRYQPVGTILDYGCGTGDFLNHCQQHGWLVEGVEPSTDARAKAEQLIGKTLNLSLPIHGKTTYDAITLWHVLEHIHDLQKTLTDITARLTPSGTIFIAVPNHTSPDAKEYGSYWAGYDVPRHLWHFSKDTMSTLLKKTGLKIVAIQPMKLDAFYVSLLSETYQNPNQPKWVHALKALYRGLASNTAARKTKNHSSLIYIATRA
ncbi:MAG: class I SAM-dependent methyltransferase [Flammeovirgaceae bacterium]